MNDYDDERTLKRAVREILGGKPVDDYPINMLPKIKNYLYDLKEKAISLGQNDRIKLIQRAFVQINEIEKKNQKIEKQETEEIKPTESELENMINTMMAGEQMEPFNVKLIPLLIKCIKKRIKSHIQKDEFEIAQNYEDLHQILITEMRNGETSGHKEWLQNKIMDRLEIAEQKLKELEELYEEKLNENERITNEAIDKINQENQTELDKFDAETQGPLPPFTKTFSSELQSLRETQKKLIICKRFKEAANVRDKIKEIIEIELEDIEDKHFRSRESQREQILDMHYQRIDCIITKSESQRIRINEFFGKKIDSLKKQIAFFERQLDLINSSKRFKKQYEPSVSFEITPNEYQPKISKTRTPMSVRQLSMRDPWSLFFDSSKRLNVTKIDELPEPHWKTIEPRQTDTEVYSQFVSSLVSTPKSWERVHGRKVSSAKTNKQNWQNNQSIYSTNRRNKSEEKKNRVSLRFNYFNNENDENDKSNTITPNRTKTKRNSKKSRSSSLSRSRNGLNGVKIYSGVTSNNNNNNDNNNNKSKRNYYSYSESNRNDTNLRKSSIKISSNNYNSSNNTNTNTKKYNTYNSSDNKVSITNSNNYNNLVSNFDSASTFNKNNNNTISSIRHSDKYSSLSDTTMKSKTHSNKSSLTTNMSSDNNQKVSVNNSSVNFVSNSNSKSSIKKSKKAGQSDFLELSSNIYYNGLTYTQTIDARRNKAIQTKNKKSLANLFGEKSDFEKFCQTVPPSRKEQLPNYL